MEQPVQNQPDILLSKQEPISSGKHKLLLNVLLIVLLIAGFGATFAGGYYLRSVLSTEVKPPDNPKATQNPLPSASPTAPDDPGNPGEVQQTTVYLPGKHYFDDTVMLVTKESPHLAVIATVSRLEQEGNYLQNSRVSFFNGTSWTRKSTSGTHTDSGIVSDVLVRSWNINYDPSRVLKQSAFGTLVVEGHTLVFNTPMLHNEIPMRSIPGYTKFMSSGEGNVTIDGNLYTAYLVYTRIYSSNAADMQFYDTPFDLTTDWVAFWDNNGAFYHIDKTSVPNGTATYQSHEIGMVELPGRLVGRTYGVDVSRNNTDSPDLYTVTMGEPLGYTLQYRRLNMVDKAPNGSYTWQMGVVEGTVTNAQGNSVQGFGINEYIHH